MYDYINEAFKKLSLLNEELFDTSLNGINQLSDFMKEDDVDNTVDVIDPEAKKENEISDSYIGKVIVNCNICHSHIFKSKEDIEIDDDGVVNSTDICPYCGEDGGFVVVGEICKFTEPSDPNVEKEENDHESEDDVADEDDIKDESETSEEVEEAVDLSLIPGTVADVLIRHKDEINACGGDEVAVKKLITDILSGDEVKNANDALEAIRKINSCSGGKLWSTIATYMTSQRVAAVGSEAKRRRLTASLAEDVNKVNVETDDSIICVKADEDCEVTISTESKEDKDTEEESVEPVSDETVVEIESQNGIEPEESEKQEESAEEDAEEDTDKSIDVDIEEVDEKIMDELGESYLKSVYENVDSFRTTGIFTDSDDKHLVVEGLITFKSGAKKSTGFIFEAHSATESGKVKFVGKNDHFSKGNKSFILTGNVSNKTFLPESLTYNYRVKTADGNFSKLHGIVHTAV